MTPTQLRAYAAVARHGSVKRAAAELAVSESAVSLHIGQLRKELGDQLFNRTAAGLAFTPGGLRLASRSAELLGLQDRTIREVGEASRGGRLLRVAASSLFAELAAPGLLELFGARAADLDVELSVRDPAHFATLLQTRAIDIAIGPEPAGLDSSVVSKPVMNYQIVLVVGPDHPLATVKASPGLLREQTWLLGPSAVSSLGGVPTLVRRLGVAEDRQQIFQSHAAAIEEAKRGKGVAPVLSYTVASDLAQGRLVRISAGQTQIDGVWHTLRLAEQGVPSPAAELSRFAATPRAVQAMVKGTGVTVGRFRPSIHVTLWS